MSLLPYHISCSICYILSRYIWKFKSIEVKTKISCMPIPVHVPFYGQCYRKSILYMYIGPLQCYIALLRYTVHVRISKPIRHSIFWTTSGGDPRGWGNRALPPSPILRAKKS